MFVKVVDAFTAILMEMQQNDDIVQTTDSNSGISYVRNGLCIVQVRLGAFSLSIYKFINQNDVMIFWMQKYVRDNDRESLKTFIDNPFRENLGKYQYYHYPIIFDAKGTGGRH